MNNNSPIPDINKVKLEYRVILDLIPSGSSVLDLGCGDGELLNLLIKTKNVRGSGVEIDEQAVRKCASLGISVSQQDIDLLAEVADNRKIGFTVAIQVTNGDSTLCSSSRRQGPRLGRRERAVALTQEYRQCCGLPIGSGVGHHHHHDGDMERISEHMPQQAKARIGLN